MSTVLWHHGTGFANANGVAYQELNAGNGTHAIGGGGFAEPDENSTSTDEGGNDAYAALPMVGSWPSVDLVNDIRGWTVAFGAPPGHHIRIHMFIVVEEDI